MDWMATRNLGELPADAQGDRERADRQLRRLRDPVSQAMRERYNLASDDVEFIDRLIETSVNLVGCIYSKVYFPIFSNSLKEVGRYLVRVGLAKGFWRRNATTAAGLGAQRDDGPQARTDSTTTWTTAEQPRRSRITVRVCGGGASGLDAVDVNSLEVGFEQTWGKFDSASPEFAKINDAAYWDYQRDRMYIRSNPSLRKAAKRKHQNGHRSLRVNTTVDPSRPCKCPACNSKRISMNGRHRRISFDLRFSEGGLRRWITKHIVDHYKCRDCGFSFASEARRLNRYRYGDKF